MTARRISLRVMLVLVVAAAGACTVGAGSAAAKTYSDVPRGHWARTYISSVTNRTASGYALLHDYGRLFRPERAITRQHLARSLVLASGRYRTRFTPIEIADVQPGHRYYRVIQLAVRHKYLGLDAAGNFRPTKKVTASAAEVAVVRWLKDRYPHADWSLLSTLAPSRWRPNPGWNTGAPAYLPSVVASRQLGLRFNHPAGDDGHEVTPREPIDRAEIAYMFYRGYALASGWELSGLAAYRRINFPALSPRQRQVATLAFKYIGYPYVWGGEFPTENSPYGLQKSGGFDCSGFVFYLMKIRLGYPITVNERGARDMAARAKPRLKRAQLTCGDIIFFGPRGTASSVESIYHAGLYLGNGWFIHSTGSSDGVTLASLNSSSYWKGAFAWGRRLLTPAELVVPIPSPSSTGAPATTLCPAPSPSSPAPASSPAASPLPGPSESAPAAAPQGP